MPHDHARSRDGRLPRVLFAAQLDPSRKFGTFEEQTFALARAFRERSGVFVPLYQSALGSEAAAMYREAGLAAEGLDLGVFRLSTLRELTGLVRAHRIEVVHWNFYEPIKNGYLWALSLLAPGVRHFLTDHTSRPPGGGANVPVGPTPRGALKRRAYARYAKVFRVSDFVSESLQGGPRWGNVGRWMHLVNTERFSPSASVRREVRERLGAGSDGRFVAVLVAALRPGKGVEVALRAMALLPESVSLWVVGDGPMRAGLEASASPLGVRVRFFGTRRDVAPFLRGADCLLCPSLWAEAAGLVNLEALACGVPVVASRTGGIPEYVEDGKTGLLVPAGDPEPLARAVRGLMADPLALRAMAAAARAAALERFSIEERIGEYLDLYRPEGRDLGRADLAPATAWTPAPPSRSGNCRARNGFVPSGVRPRELASFGRGPRPPRLARIGFL